MLQPTNEAFRRAIDPALLTRLLTANRTEDVPLLSQLLQFHSVPSPLPLAVSGVKPGSRLGSRIHVRQAGHCCKLRTASPMHDPHCLRKDLSQTMHRCGTSWQS